MPLLGGLNGFGLYVPTLHNRLESVTSTVVDTLMAEGVHCPVCAGWSNMFNMSVVYSMTQQSIVGDSYYVPFTHGIDLGAWYWRKWTDCVEKRASSYMEWIYGRSTCSPDSPVSPHNDEIMPIY